MAESTHYLELTDAELCSLYGILYSTLRGIAVGPALKCDPLTERLLLLGTQRALGIMNKLVELQPQIADQNEAFESILSGTPPKGRSLL